MWARKYSDYPPDSGLKKETVQTGKGIIGCEMNENFGWGELYHIHPKPNKKGFFRSLLVKDKKE